MDRRGDLGGFPSHPSPPELGGTLQGLGVGIWGGYCLTVTPPSIEHPKTSSPVQGPTFL